MQSARHNAVLRVLVDWQTETSTARLRKYRLFVLTEMFLLLLIYSYCHIQSGLSVCGNSINGNKRDICVPECTIDAL